MKRILRVIIATAILLMLLSGLGVVYQSTTSARDTETFSPAGELFLVDGTNMHLHCTGQGSPTIILENGVGGNTLLWAHLQPSIAETTRVCAYDRAGYGWSEARSGERSTEAMVDELRGLLTLGDIEPPYILVGHSFGGLLIRAFTAEYPGEVVGLVLIDAAHPNQFSAHQCIPACFPQSAVALVDTFYALLPTTARVGLVRLLVPSGALPLPFFAIPADFPDRDALIASLSTTAHSETVTAEWDAYPQNAEDVSETGTLGALPVRLVTALGTYHEQPLPGESPDVTTQTWAALQADLLTLSTDVKQTTLHDATHFSLLMDVNQAAAVSRVITDLTTAVR